MVAAIPVALLLNAFTMLRFWQDKARARSGDRRISEADLLGLALLGGSLGALAACHLFRHKTRKQPFGMQLRLIAVMQAGVVICLLV